MFIIKSILFVFTQTLNAHSVKLEYETKFIFILVSGGLLILLVLLIIVDKMKKLELFLIYYS